MSPTTAFVTSGVSLFWPFSACSGRATGDRLILLRDLPHLLNVLDIVPVCSTPIPTFARPPSVSPPPHPRTRGSSCHASNPTGVAREPNGIADLAESKGLLVISDEIYDAFLYDAEPFSIGSRYPLTLTLGGFSKSHAMTGWRLGWAAGPPEIVRAMTTFQQYTFVAAPTPTPWAGLAAIGVETHVARAAYRKKRDRLVAGLRGHYEFPVPEGAFYLFPRVPNGCGTGADFCAGLIKETAPGHPRRRSWARTHFRISYAASGKRSTAASRSS